MVGPLMAAPPEPLPAALDTFLLQGLADGHGGVFVSMGTMARMTEEELHSMARGLSALPNPILWKLNLLDIPGGHSWVTCKYYMKCPA